MATAHTTWLTQPRTSSPRSTSGRTSARRRDLAQEPTAISEKGKGLILLVEDELDLQELLRHHLVRDGYDVVTCDRGEHAIHLVDQRQPKLVLLDLMLPGIDGLEVCRRLRNHPNNRHTPIIMLTAKGEEVDVVSGLEMGADDYITKPFATRVLLARVRALIRRAEEQPRSRSESVEDDGDAPIQVLDLIIRPARHEVTIAGESIDLTATEFKLLMLLARKPGRVFTRQQIIHAIHGPQAAVTDRSVDVQVLHLRRKLGPNSDFVQAVRGVGYRFRDEA